jgi:hypothetical protein
LTTKQQKKQYKEFLKFQELQNMNKKKNSRGDNEDEADESQDEVVNNKTKKMKLDEIELLKLKLKKAKKHLQMKPEEKKQTHRFAKAQHPSKVKSEDEDEEEEDDEQERNDDNNEVVAVKHKKKSLSLINAFVANGQENNEQHRSKLNEKKLLSKMMNFNVMENLFPKNFSSKIFQKFAPVIQSNDKLVKLRESKQAQAALYDYAFIYAKLLVSHIRDQWQYSKYTKVQALHVKQAVCFMSGIPMHVRYEADDIQHTGEELPSIRMVNKNIIDRLQEAYV